MNIAIDITSLESAHGRRGTGVYTKNLVEALERYASHHTYSLFTRKQKVPDNADIVHYPYFDPFFLTLPLVKPKPTVVTVHDLIPLVFPEHFPKGIRGSIKWQIQKISLRNVRRIITDSDSSKRDIEKITGFPEDRIDTVYLAPDPVIRRVEDAKPIVKAPYILYVGDVNWNKNIPSLLRAFKELPKNMKLILVGKAFIDSGITETKEVNRLIESLGLVGSVVRTGFITEEKLSSLYSNASCLVLPSFYEGFGLPVLEAMSCGCPVVAANISSLTEIAGPAIKVQPESSKSISEGIQRVLASNVTERKKLISEGYAWVSKFSWATTAKETVVSYEKAINNNSGI